MKANDLDGLVALFGPDGKELVDTSDPATGRRNREVFAVGRRRRAGGSSIAARPQGARHRQRGVAVSGAAREDARPAGRSTPPRARRKCWPAASAATSWPSSGSAAPTSRRSGLRAARPRRQARGPVRAPLRQRPGQAERAVLAGGARRAAQPARRSGRGGRRGRAAGSATARAPSPFHGYYFRILEARAPPRRAARRTTSSNGEMTGGFALVAWPAQYDVTGVMTFIVNQDGVVYEKDLGPETAAMAGKLSELQSRRVLEAGRVTSPKTRVQTASQPGEEARAAPREARAENRGLRRDLPMPASIHVTSAGRLKQGTRRASPIGLRQSRSTRHPGLRLAVYCLRCRASSTRRRTSFLARLTDQYPQPPAGSDSRSVCTLLSTAPVSRIRGSGEKAETAVFLNAHDT